MDEEVVESRELLIKESKQIAKEASAGEFDPEKYGHTKEVMLDQIKIDYINQELPNVIFRKKGSFLKDEKGNVFEIDSPMHCSFVGVVPEWYMKSLTYIIKDIDPEKIGRYVKLFNK